jgi:hypothetical protein
MRVRVLPFLLAAASLACGGGGAPPEAPGGGAPATRVVVASGDFPALPSSQGGNNPIPATRAIPYTIPVGGAMEATVNWGSAANRFAIAFYPGGCTVGQLGFGACNPLLQGDSSQKPAYVHLHAFTPGAYTLGIQNLGPGTESCTYEVTITY